MRNQTGRKNRAAPTGGCLFAPGPPATPLLRQGQQSRRFEPFHKPSRHHTTTMRPKRDRPFAEIYTRINRRRERLAGGPRLHLVQCVSSASGRGTDSSLAGKATPKGHGSAKGTFKPARYGLQFLFQNPLGSEWALFKQKPRTPGQKRSPLSSERRGLPSHPKQPVCMHWGQAEGAACRPSKNIGENPREGRYRGRGLRRQGVINQPVWPRFF